MKINRISALSSTLRRLLSVTAIGATSLLVIGGQTASAGAMIYLPDDNLDRYLIQQGFDSGELDDQIPFASAQQVKSIILPDGDINSFEGLQDFRNLEYVDFSGNDEEGPLGFGIDVNWTNDLPNLRTLKIGGSKVRSIRFYNTRLENVDVSNCRNLVELSLYGANLKTLNLNGATDLEFLDVTGGSLTSIDLSTQPKLKNLKISNNRLTSINISSLDNLTYLDLTQNRLTGIDTSKNPDLRSLYLGNNKLTTVNLAKNTALENVVLSDNLLTSLDLSRNIRLTYVNVNQNRIPSLNVSANPYLETLSVAGNKIASLDVTRLPALKSINASANKIKKLNLQVNPELVSISVPNNPLRKLQLSSDLQNLKLVDISSTKIKHLDLRGVNLAAIPNDTWSLNYYFWNGSYYGSGLIAVNTSATVVVDNPEYLRSINFGAIDDNVKLVRK